MELTGRQIIGGETSGEGPASFFGLNPATGEKTTPPIHEATSDEVDRALRLADAAFETYRGLGPESRGDFLERVAHEWLELGDVLLEQARAETALPLARLSSERARMIHQARMFASLMREGSWLDARIDRGDPARQPLPKPDVRRMLQPIGPAVVFGASNFPLAISVGGSDVVAALAVGSTVVAKAHPAHPGTCEMIARAIGAAARSCGVPPGVFSMVHGRGEDVGLALVRHPLTRVVAFTGSLRGGRALFDAACSRPDPIPVYAEMGSLNPVFVMPGALAARGAAIADGYVQSVTLGTGQFCTNPGLLLGVAGRALDAFLEAVGARARQVTPACMLHQGISRSFLEAIERLRRTSGVRVVGESDAAPDARRAQAPCAIFATDLGTLEAGAHLWDEVFGPASVIVGCDSVAELERLARRLRGHLTASVHALPEELESCRTLIRILEDKVGRLVFNGFPTGIEVCAAIHHGGPYPATTDVHYTSIGAASIDRFARPICYQGFPQDALPIELRDHNARGIWRLVDERRTRDDC